MRKSGYNDSLGDAETEKGDVLVPRLYREHAVSSGHFYKYSPSLTAWMHP